MGTLALVVFLLLILPLLLLLALAFQEGFQVLYLYGAWLLCLAFVLFLDAPLTGRWFSAQRTIATTWLFLRRAVSFCLAGVLLIGAFQSLSLLAAPASISIHQFLLTLAFGVVLLFLAAAVIWNGVFGQGPNRFSLRDDVAQHNRNKERFKWRW